MSGAATLRHRPRPAAAPGGAVRRARLRRRARVATVTLTLAGVCLLAFCYALAIGDAPVPLREVAATLVGRGDGGSEFVILRLRLPRALVAVLAGAAFGLSGAIFQTLVRNPLASPDIIGITGGASAGALLAILAFGPNGVATSAAAFAGALGVAAVIYSLAWRHGVTGYRLVLAGVAMAALAQSIVSYGLTRLQVYDAREALVWLTGSLNAMTWTTVQFLGWSLAALVPLALLAGRWLHALELGDDSAAGLGLGVERARLGTIAVAVGLAAVATAAAGPVVFVAFVAGPIARRLVGNNGIALVPAAAVGALLMTVADMVAQHAFGSLALPVGVVTAAVGAPYLLWLLAVANRGGRGY